MLSRITESCRHGDSFGLESTLSGRSYLRLIPIWKRQGYHIVLHFLELPSVDLAIIRVEMRVKHGGHHIPEYVTRRRFKRGMMNLPEYQHAVDEWKIWDTSQGEPELIDES